MVWREHHIYLKTKNLLKSSLAKTLLFWFLLILVCAVIFYLRYPFNYHYSNFYAEDGTIFVKNILDEGPIKGALSLFNGYLVIGLYLLTDFAMFINSLFGQGFETLAKALAVVSYVFWGVVVTLPFLLFRRQLGTTLSLLAVALLAIVPAGGYDYAMIGTIGNLKFAFFYVATLLVVYRNQTSLVKKGWQFIIIDALLMLCVLTNVIVVAVLPFALWRYRDKIKGLFKKTKATLKSLSLGHYSLFLLALLSSTYVISVYARGIPEMPGYLDEPLIASALLDVLYRGSVYGLTFAVNVFMNDYVATLLLVASLVLFIISRHRITLLFIAYAIAVNVLGFALNRPGITHLFQAYAADGGPGLFFYAGTLLFVFAVVYVVKDWFRSQKVLTKAVVAVCTLIFCITVLPASGVGKLSYTNINSTRPTLAAEVERVCGLPVTSTVEVGVYPAVNWTLTLPREQVCKSR